MANIFCTRKLERLIGKSLMASEPEPSTLGNWNAHIFPMKGRKCLILMNDQSYYALLFVDILKKDILNLHELLFERLIEQLHHDHVDFPVKGTPELMDALKPRFLPTNNNRKVLGTINEYVYTTELHLHHNYQGLIQLINLPELNGRLNDNLVGALKAKKLEYGRPIEEMKIIINQVCG